MDKLRDLLDVIYRHPRRAWAGLVAYAAAVTFPHEVVQFYVNEIANRITHHRLYQVSAAIALFEGALLTLIVFRSITTSPGRGRRKVGVFWVVTLVLIWCAWRILTANNVELVHYPQYFPEGMALFALTLSASESMAWVTLFGGLDECFQYWDLMGGKRVPYDFNDVYMDLLGGALGVVFAMAFVRREAPQKRAFTRPGIFAILTVLLAGIALWASGRMGLYDDPDKHYWFALSRVRIPAFWFQVVANGPNKYHTLSPIEGPIVILATIALYAILDRRSIRKA